MATQHRGMRFSPAIRVALAATALAAITACGGDDGGGVRELDGSESATGGAASGSATGAASGAASGAATGAASGSGTGISTEGVDGAGMDNPLVAEGVTRYRAYIGEQIEQMGVDAVAFTDAVRAGDVDAAQAAYAPSRQAWERIEPIAGLIEQIDVAVDARVDDFASPTDPTWTGWHRIEYQLWEEGNTDGMAELADQLDADLASLAAGFPDLEIAPVIVARGAAELIEEVSTGKITGEENRYAGTDLWDFHANVEGSEEAFTSLRPAIEEADPDLASDIDAKFTRVEDLLEPYRDGDGWQPFSALTEADTEAMKAALADLSESLSLVEGVLGLS
jgi:iron uptake system component EfeO